MNHVDEAKQVIKNQTRTIHSKIVDLQYELIELIHTEFSSEEIQQIQDEIGELNKQLETLKEALKVVEKSE